MPLSRNARRRLLLYGPAAGIVLLAILVPRLVERRAPQARIRLQDLDRARSHEATRMLRDLLRIDTTDPPGVTRPAVELLARAFACEGIPYEIVGDDPRRPLIVARLSGRSQDESLLLLNHLDVVPAGDLTLWSRPPFAGEFGTGLESPYLFGRGALDMKGQAVASFWAMAQLKRQGIVPLRDIVFLGETGEETYRPEIGIGWVMSHRPDLLAGVTDVYNEGGVNETLGEDIQRFGIEVLQKGAVNYEVDAATKEELDAIRVYCDVHNGEEPYRTSPAILEFLAFIGPSRSDVWGRAMANPERIVENARFRKEAPDVYQNLLRDRLYWGPLRKRPDGRWEMELAWSLLPGSDVDEKGRELEAMLRSRGLGFRLRLKTSACVASPESGRGWDALARSFSLDPVEHASVGIWVLPGSYTNSSWARAHGLRAYGISPFNVNIYCASTIHHENERIQVAFFVDGVERMARIVREYATAP